MQQDSPKCLFDLWKQTSAPMFHTSELWPSFSEAAVDAFLQGTADEPLASRPLDTAAARTARQKIEQFLQAIAPLSEAEYACKQAYIDFEQERLHTLDQILFPHDAQKTGAANDALYGTLAELRASDALAYLKWYMDRLVPRGAAVAEYRDQLLEAWRDVAGSDSLGARFTAFDACRQQLRPFAEARFGFVEELLAAYRPGESLPAKEVCAVLQRAMAPVLGEYAGDWQAVLQDGAPNAFIDYARRAVVIPAGRRYTKEHVHKLVVHEIGVHVGRSVNGEHSRERLAGLGMAHYGAAEEAFGVFLQDTTKDEYDYLHDLAAFALLEFATRPGQPAPPTFRAVHHLMQALYACIGNLDDATYPEHAAAYARRAFAITIRTLRLGNTSFADRSTTKYWRGYSLLTDYFAEAGLTQATFDQLFVGKYDCFSNSQLQLILSHATA